VWERFAEHLPTVASACCLTSLAAMAVEAKRWRRSRARRGCWDFALACGSSGLLAFAAAITPAGLAVWLIPGSPWPTLAIAIPVGLSVDLAKEAGPLRVLKLSLHMVARVSRAMAGGITPDSPSDSDSDA
jgi:hypothetical protein